MRITERLWRISRPPTPCKHVARTKYRPHQAQRPPDLGRNAWWQADTMPSWAVEHLTEMSGCADFVGFAAAIFSAELLTLTPH